MLSGILSSSKGGHSAALDQYRTTWMFLSSISQVPFMWKDALPGSKSTWRIPVPTKAEPAIDTVDAGIRIEVSWLQEQNAQAWISRSFDPGSTVISLSARFGQASEVRKQFSSMTSTEAGTQTDSICVKSLNMNW
jgi:hypothetical protein